MNSCRHIHQIISAAGAEENKILSVSKSELMDVVIWMNNPLSSKLRDVVMRDMKNLKYAKTKNVPHRLCAFLSKRIPK